MSLHVSVTNKNFSHVLNNNFGNPCCKDMCPPSMLISFATCCNWQVLCSFPLSASSTNFPAVVQLIGHGNNSPFLFPVLDIFPWPFLTTGFTQEAGSQPFLAKVVLSFWTPCHFFCLSALRLFFGLQPLIGSATSLSATHCFSPLLLCPAWPR